MVEVLVVMVVCDVGGCCGVGVGGGSGISCGVGRDKGHIIHCKHYNQ